MLPVINLARATPHEHNMKNVSMRCVVYKLQSTILAATYITATHSTDATGREINGAVPFATGREINGAVPYATGREINGAVPYATGREIIGTVRYATAR